MWYQNMWSTMSWWEFLTILWNFHIISAEFQGQLPENAYNLDNACTTADQVSPGEVAVGKNSKHLKIAAICPLSELGNPWRQWWNFDAYGRPHQWWGDTTGGAKGFTPL